MPKALPISYKGIRFRSRLEADWALTLDTLGITWQYEPEGFELSDGSCYSPDFWLPSARAWLEVKGSHMFGVNKVEQFAADLWADSGATSTYEPTAPMVLLGREPRAADPALTNLESYVVTGIMGFGKAYSVAPATCPACDQGTVVALWQPSCRGCGTVFTDALDAWMDSVHRSWLHVGFRRVIRPAGRS